MFLIIIRTLICLFLKKFNGIKVTRWSPLNSVDSTFNGYILTYLKYPLFYNDFWILVLIFSQLNHGESENHSFENLWCIVRTPGQKNPKKRSKFQIHYILNFQVFLNRIDHEEYDNRDPEKSRIYPWGSRTRGYFKKVKLSKSLFFDFLLGFRAPRSYLFRDFGSMIH